MIAEALTAATPTLRDVAGWVEVEYNTVRAYKLRARNASPAFAESLAGALREHAQELTTLAKQLDRAAQGREG